MKFDQELSPLITKDEYLTKLESKSGSNAMSKSTLSALRSFDKFCQAEYKESAHDIFSQIKKKIDETNNSKYLTNIMSKYTKWCSVDHLDLEKTVKKTWQKRSPYKAKDKLTIRNYLSVLKGYIIDVEGINVSDRNYREIPIPDQHSSDLDFVDDEESEPFTIDEMRAIIEYTKDQKMKAWLMFMKCTSARPYVEAGQIRKKDIDFTKNPPVVTFPKNMVKGKRSTRINYLDVETAPRVKAICDKIDDDDSIFRKKGESIKALMSRSNKMFERMRVSLGSDYPSLIEKNSKGFYKKRPHSFRKTCATNYENALAKIHKNARDLAHAYIGHNSYLKTYFAKSEQQKIEMFRQFEQSVLIYSKTEIIDSSMENAELLEQNKQLLKRMNTIEELLYDIAKDNPKTLEKLSGIVSNSRNFVKE